MEDYEMPDTGRTARLRSPITINHPMVGIITISTDERLRLCEEQPNGKCAFHIPKLAGTGQSIVLLDGLDFEYTYMDKKVIDFKAGHITYLPDSEHVGIIMFDDGVNSNMISIQVTSPCAKETAEDVINAILAYQTRNTVKK